MRERHPDGVDALLDVVSYAPEDFEANAGALRQGGRGASMIGAAGDGPGRFNIMSSEDPARTERLRQLLDEGNLRVPIEDTYTLDRAGEALGALANAHTQGKRSIRVASSY